MKQRPIVVKSCSLAAITLSRGLTDCGIQAASPMDLAGSKPGPDKTRHEDIYGFWEFPEVWVEVPDKPARSRPKSLRPGLTIHALERGRFVETPVSHAFPGWTAVEIHRATNEPALECRNEDDFLKRFRVK